jgi:hypothetical protein
VPLPLLLRATTMQPEPLIPGPQLTVSGGISCVLLCRRAPSIPWMMVGAQAALRRAAAARRQRYGDSILFSLRLARREGGQSKGGQGALCAPLAQGPPQSRRWSGPGSAGSRRPEPRSGRARESSPRVCCVLCVHVLSACTHDRPVYVSSARRFVDSAGEPAAFN